MQLFHVGCQEHNGKQGKRVLFLDGGYGLVEDQMNETTIMREKP